MYFPQASLSIPHEFAFCVCVEILRLFANCLLAGCVAGSALFGYNESTSSRFVRMRERASLPLTAIPFRECSILPCIYHAVSPPSAMHAQDLKHLLARRPLMDCNNNARMYKSRITYLSHDNFSKIPPELLHDLRKLLSVNELSRPSALDFTGSPFFCDDTRLRALRFLDHMLERDNMQKSEFLKALLGMWKDFDACVLRYKVLPPLCAELRNVVMQPMILPLVSWKLTPASL